MRNANACSVVRMEGSGCSHQATPAILNGWQVADHLRALGIPVIFITADPSREAKGIANQLGAQLIGKPFDPLLLPDIVRVAVGQRTE